MTTFGKLILALVVLVLAAGGWLLFGAPRGGAPSQQATTTQPTIIPGTPDQTYTDHRLSFSITYPSSAASSSVDYSGYLALTQTPLTSFVLPGSMFAGTNLEEAGLYVGASSSPAVIQSCGSTSPMTGETASGSTTINGADFWVYRSAGAGAGNYYETTTYRRLENGWCVELVELLHSGNIGNYTQGSVKEFNKAEFESILEAMVHTYRSIPTGL